MGSFRHWRPVCAALLAVLGIPLLPSCQNQHHVGRSIKVEGFKLQDTGMSVYGGPGNYIHANLYGKVTDSTSQGPLAGMKVEVYSGTRQQCCVYTEEDGTFSIDSLSVWAGVSVIYTMIVSDPAHKFVATKKDLSFELDEVSKEELVSLDPKK